MLACSISFVFVAGQRKEICVFSRACATGSPGSSLVCESSKHIYSGTSGGREWVPSFNRVSWNQ